MSVYLQDVDVTLYHGDVLEVLRELPDESVDCAATSPPFYGLRDYGVEGQIGLEATPEEWRDRLVEVFRELRRVLVPTGTLWVECGDSYAGGGGYAGDQAPSNAARIAAGVGVGGQKVGPHTLSAKKSVGRLANAKPKDLIGSPFLLAFGLRDDGWWWRSTSIWHKPNCLPESVTDRPVVSHSYVFQFSKKARYFHDAEAVREPAEWARWGDQTTPKYNGTDTATGWIQNRSKEELEAKSERALRSVWSIPTQGFSASGIGYDSPYTASADCPKHGLAADPESWQRAARGEPQDRRQYRIDGNDARRALEHASESGANSLHIPNPPSSGEPQTPQSTDESRTHDASLRLGDGLDDGDETLGRSSSTSDRDAPPADSSDSPRPERSDSATPHSTESRRTDPVPATTEPCTPSAQSPDRTGDTPASPELSEIASTPESRSAESVDSDVGLSVQTRSRTARKCTCEQDTIDHFATWPTKLAERIIKMGTSERGKCHRCSAPWVREVESTPEKPGAARVRNVGGRTDGHTIPAEPGGLGVTSTTTLGWKPSCECVYDFIGKPIVPYVVPAVVLDPFVGSGTTCHVARKLGRRSVGIDLNAEYLALAAKRLAQQSLLAVEA